MKLVIASGTFLPEVSGQATFVLKFVQEFRGDDITKVVIAYGDQVEFDQYVADNHFPVSDDLKVFKVKRNKIRYFRYCQQLRQNIKDADIIYAQDLVSSGLPAALAKKRNNKLVIRIGGDFLWEKMVNAGKIDTPLSQYHNQKKSLQEKFYLAIYKFVLSRCDRIIFNTDWQRQIYEKVFEIPATKIAVIGNSVNVSFDQLEEKEVSNNNTIIFAGRFVPLKNLKRLIKAFKLVKTDKQLVLIGNGPEKSALEKLAQGDDRIKILPELSQEKLFNQVARSSFVVVPSLSEINPNFALEAFNLNKPVLLTQEVGFPEEIKKHFKLIDPLSIESIKQGIEYFLDKKNYQQYINQTGNILAINNWDEVVDQHLKIFFALK